jgi:spore maturation protein CgeB
LYRVLKVSTVYPQVARAFEQESARSPEATWLELRESFRARGYVHDHFSAEHFKALGCEAEDLFVNLRPLQLRWAKEHGVAVSELTWRTDVAIEQIRELQPDVLVIEDLYVFDRPLRERIRDVLPRPVLMVGSRSAPTVDFGAFGDLDLIVSADPNFVERFSAHGARAELIPLGFEVSVLDRVEPASERSVPFAFVGGLGAPHGAHSRRYALVEQLLSQTPLQVWGETFDPAANGRLRARLASGNFRLNQLLARAGAGSALRRKLPLIRRAADWAADPLQPSLATKFPGRVQEPVFGYDYFRLLATAQTVLNVHIDCADDLAGNLRLYEATGMRSCLVTDAKRNLFTLFEPDVEVVTYRNAEECVEKITYLLSHSAERESIAFAGQRRTLREHTRAHRAQRLLELMQARA